VVAPLLDLCGHGGARGVALLSSERVRLLRCGEGSLEELDDWELSVTMLDWRERKAQSTSNPARAQGVSSSGHDQFGERLDHNRQRFLSECGGLVAQCLEQEGLDELIVFGPAKDAESFEAGFDSSPAQLSLGGDQDLISVPTGQLSDVVSKVAHRLDTERDRTVVERALAETRSGGRGAAGLQEVKEALAEGRVDHLVFDARLGEEAESLIRAALAGGGQVTVVREELAKRLVEAGGAAAILRY
jgi:stalled ribosome rescue protein Dom34